MFGMLNAFTLDPEIVHDKAEHKWAPHMTVKAGVELCFIVHTPEQAFL